LIESAFEESYVAGIDSNLGSIGVFNDLHPTTITTKIEIVTNFNTIFHWHQKKKHQKKLR
jgi:hypothetical protein